MISDDDLDPKTKQLRPRVLDDLSVPELREYVQSLKDEIVRVEADITRKEKHKSAVDALFGNAKAE
ncbi:MAG: DUF1192 domain-containing protein [Alphaproteobacteria bacterium]|nr:DUF1192 domain-containing protein [Alphaproteobacteria bacterium]